MSAMIYLPLLEGENIYVSASHVIALYPLEGKALSCGIELVNGSTYSIDLSMLSVLERLDPRHPDLKDEA